MMTLSLIIIGSVAVFVIALIVGTKIENRWAACREAHSNDHEMISGRIP